MIVIGVEESEDKYIPSGLKCFEDKARLSNNLERFIPGNLIAKTRIENFEFEKEVYGQLHDKKFQCIVIEVDNKDLPYLSIKDGNNIRKNRIYTRRNTSVVDANNTEINQILERRIATMYSHSKNLDFEVHLGQLKILYNNIKKSKVHRVGGLNEQLAKSIKSSLAGVIGHEENVRNPKYPELDFEDFISECISEKQKRIKKELDIN